ncbi:MAG: polyprenyl synthetase family protein [Candidatus Latescibacteria bacterium]|nr:polyprenyl synthetase family protein [Candidatus Latescibacterota bacterium]
MDLRTILAPIQDDLAVFEQEFKEMFRSNIDVIDQIADHLIRAKGKRLRPALVLLSAATHGQPRQDAIRVAAIVELIHTATLVHDDVVDEATVRRGLPSLNSIWDNHVSVLLGDYLLAKALTLILLLDSRDMMLTISRSTERLSKGELLQANQGADPDITEAEYFEIIGDKTASLVSAGCEIGAFLTSGSKDVAACFRQYGESLGLAFQIADDLLDFVGDADTIGKPTGNDVRTGTVTLPLIRALQRAPHAEAAAIREIIDGEIDDGDWQRVIEFTKARGGIEYARQKAEAFAATAKAQLNSVKDSPAKRSLLAMVDYAIDREK